MSIKLLETLPAPGEVIIFFIRRLFHLLAGFLATGCQRLALVECLGTDFTGVIDPHHADALCFFSGRKLIVCGRTGRIVAARANWLPEYGSQGLIDIPDTAIKKGLLACFHALEDSMLP